MTLFSRASGQERREDIDELMQELRDVADALDRAERKLAAIEAMDGLDAGAIRRATTHVRLFCRPSGYTLVEADEPPPPVGEAFDEGDERFVVERLAPSPLAGDGRRCAVLAWISGPSSDAEDPAPAA